MRVRPIVVKKAYPDEHARGWWDEAKDFLVGRLLDHALRLQAALVDVHACPKRFERGGLLHVELLSNGIDEEVAA